MTNIWIDTCIYTEKYSMDKQKFENIKKLKVLHNSKSDFEIEAEIERIKREEIPVPEGVKIKTNPKANWVWIN